MGTDIQRGYTWAADGQVTNTNLHGNVDDAVILTTFISQKPALVGTDLADGDTVVVHDISGSALVKVQLTELLNSPLTVLGSANLGPDSVGSSQIQAGAVGSAEMGNGAIGTAQLQSNIIRFSNLTSEVYDKFGLKNQLICPCFQGWQRGTSFTNPATGTPVADMWMVDKANGSGTAPSVNVIRNGSIIDTGFDVSCELAITATGTTGASMNWILRNAIEGMSLQSTAVVGSIRIRASGSLTLGGSLKLIDSTGTIASTAVTALTTAWQTVTVTGTFGAHTANSAKLAFYLADGTQPSGTGSVYVQWMQLEKGTTATAFEIRPLSLDQSMAYRFCYVAGADFKDSTLTVEAYSGVMTTGNNLRFSIPFPLTMRATPTFTYSGTNSNDQIQGGGPSTIACNTNVTSINIGRRSANLQAISGSALGVNQAALFLLNGVSTTNRLIFEAGI